MCDDDARPVDESLASTALCQVCFEPFSEHDRVPKLLPCGHTFCEKCVRSLTATFIYTCRCPKCRGAFVLRYDTTFPTNYSLMDVLSHVRQSMPVSEQDHLSTSSTPGGSRHKPSRVSKFISKLSGKNKKDTASRWIEEAPFTSTPDDSEVEEEFEQVPTESESDSDWDRDMQLSPLSDLDHAPLRRNRPSIPRTQHLNPSHTSATELPSEHIVATPIATVEEDQPNTVDTEQVQEQSVGILQSDTCPLYTHLCTFIDSIRHYGVLVFEWTVLLLLAVLLMVLIRLACTEYSVQEPSVLCNTLDVLDSWTDTRLASAAHCESTTSATLYERLHDEAHRLGTDLYDAAWRASDLVMCKGTELHEHVTAGQDSWITAISQWIAHTKQQWIAPNNEPCDEL